MTQPLGLQSIVFTFIGSVMLTTCKYDLMRTCLPSEGEWTWRAVKIGLGIPYVFITFRAESEEDQGTETTTAILWIEDEILKFLAQRPHKIMDIAVLVPGEEGASKALELFQVKEVWKSGSAGKGYPFYITTNNKKIVHGGDERASAEPKLLVYSIEATFS